MRSIVKKTAAAVLAVLMAAALCGCDRGSLMTVDGMEIKNGVYLNYLEQAYNQAGTEVEEQKKAEAEETSGDETSADENSEEETSEESLPVTKEDIAGKTGSQWIKDETLKLVRRFVAVQRKCEEVGIALTDEEENSINSQINESWDAENQYVQYIYGFKTMGEYYESKGIGKDSMKLVSKNEELESKLFMHYYGEDGEEAVSDEDFDAYLKENYASVKVMVFDYTDASGNALEKDEDKKAVKDEAQGYADRFNNGEKAVDLFYEHETADAKKSAEAKAETEYKEDNEEGLTKEQWIDKQVEDANITKSESDEELDKIFSKDASDYDEDTTDYIFSAAADGKATLYEDDSKVYVIIKEDVVKKDDWKEENKETVLKEMKEDDFDAKLDEIGAAYEVNAQDSLVNKKYGPERLEKKDKDDSQ